MTAISLTVNGRLVQADVVPRLHLADFLRDHLNLTGTHIGCEQGVCGACTVEIDGEIARSCLTFAVTCDGSAVRTIEGFDDDALMQRLRLTFSEAHALQCGYCTPGMLIAAHDLLGRRPGLDRAAIRTEMSGNLCRCTGYGGMINAIERLMKEAVEPRSATQRLGPAPIALDRPGVAAIPVNQPPQPPATQRFRGRSILVNLESITSDQDTTHLRQTFAIDHPRDAVWQLVRDPARAAALIPGVTLSEIGNDRISGQIAIRLGPIRATFSGKGTVRPIDSDYRQVITGRGDDRLSGSIAEGEIACTLHRIETAKTRLDIRLSYSLRGPLAQFGRSHLIGDLVQQIGQAFAQNLDAALTDGMPQKTAEMAPMTMLLKAIRRRFVAIVSRWIGRGK
jgi:carbon-monoxide dehydrogenase small subunit